VTALSNSQRLRAKVDLTYPVLQDAVVRLLRHEHLRDLYPQYLFTQHCMVRATVPLIETAQARAAALAPDDPVAGGLVDYLARQAAGEKDHDRWLEEDLAVTGFDVGRLARRPPPAPVAALVGAQYYWVQHFHPVALLGHIAVLEGHPPTERQATELMARTRYPEAAFRTLCWHSEADEEHRLDLYTTLDRLPLEEHHESVLGMSAFHSVHAAAAAVDHVAVLADTFEASLV
jgi:hypothetical protein